MRKWYIFPVAGIIRHIQLGRISFDDALALQEEAIEKYRKERAGLPVIFSLEHDPVITLGRSWKESNLLVSREKLERMGIDVREIDRGGDVTWHGPGQVVIYPIIALREHGIRATEWVEILEEAMILTCREYGVDAFRRDRLRGCFTQKGKIGAVGTGVKAGGITKHGLSFNVSPDTGYTKLIIPCGITDHAVTRLIDLTSKPILFNEIEYSLVYRIAELLHLKPE